MIYLNFFDVYILPGMTSKGSNILSRSDVFSGPSRDPREKIDVDKVDLIGSMINHEHSENCLLSRFDSQSNMSWSISSITNNVPDLKFV